MGTFRLFRTGDVGRLKAKKDIKALARTLKSKDAGIRRQAAEALGEIGNANAVDPLTTALRDSTRDVRWAAAVALEKTGFEPRSKAEQVAMLIAKQSWAHLVKLPAGSLIASWEERPEVSEDYAVYYVLCLVAALWEIGESLASSLIAALCDRDKNLIVRIVAARALGVIGNPQSIGSLATIFTDKAEDKRLRESAFVALRLMGECAAETMIDSLKRSNVDPDTRAGAAINLGHMGQAVIPKLVDLLRDEDANVRELGVLALACTGNPKAMEAIASMRKEKDKSVLRTMNTILQLFYPPSVDRLLSLMKDRNATTRKIAVIALGNMGDSRAIEPLIAVARSDKYEGVRSEAFYSLSKMIDNPKVRDELIQALHNTDLKWGLVAAMVLLKSGVPVLGNL